MVIIRDFGVTTHHFVFFLKNILKIIWFIHIFYIYLQCKKTMMMTKLSEIISIIKYYFNFGIEWLKNNAEYKIMGIAFILGLLTFSAWSPFMLSILIAGGYLFLIKKLQTAGFSIIQVNVEKYIINVILGLLFASLMIFII